MIAHRNDDVPSSTCATIKSPHDAQTHDPRNGCDLRNGRSAMLIHIDIRALRVCNMINDSYAIGPDEG